MKEAQPVVIQAESDGKITLGQPEFSVQAVVQATQAENDSDVLIKRLKRHRRISWYIVFAFFFFYEVLAVLSNSGFRIAGTIIILVLILTLLYALQLGSRIRRAGSEQAKPQPYWKILVSQVLPPLLMLPLFVTSWDVTGLGYWIIGGMAALVSLSNLLDSRFKAWKANLRPLLTVAIFVAAVVTGYIVEAASSRYATELAAQLQHSCKEQGRCLPAPEGWRMDGKFARSSYGHWTFTYVTNAEQSEFGLWIYMRSEVEKCIHGGSAIALSEVRSVYCRSDPKVPSSLWQYKRIDR